MKTYIEEVNRATKELENILDQVVSRKNKINRDLKPEIVEKMEADIRAEFQQAHDESP